MNLISIDFKNEKPLYLQLVEAVKQRISNNIWSLGMMIPSENELSRDFNVSVGTVKKALGILVQEGVLFRRQGKGTFVASPDFSKSFSRFFRYGLVEGDSAETPASKILEMTVIKPNSKTAEVLHLYETDDVIRIKRIRTLQKIPFAVEELYLPYERFKGIEDISIENKLLYPIYSEKFATPIIWADEYLQPDIANLETAELLGIEQNAPVMCVERIAHTYEDAPVEWRRSMGRGDSFRYHIVVR